MHSARTILLAALLATATTACGPLGPFPGGALRGPVHDGAPPDWSLAAGVETVQLEVRPADPYSVNVWCGVTGSRLYVPTSLILGTDDPNERTWVRAIADDARVRLRIDGTVYPLRAVRVEDEAERERARAALLGKYDEDADDHAAKAWIFRMEPR